MKLSEKMWLMIILKVIKYQGFALSLKNAFLAKTQGGWGGQIDSPTFLGLRKTLKNTFNKNGTTENSDNLKN